jgi:ATP-dependent DNA ligase
MQAPETFHCDGWMYEEKCDGWRSLAYKEGERIRLISCNGVDHPKWFGDIAAAITKLSAPTLVLDSIFAPRRRTRHLTDLARLP